MQLIDVLKPHMVRTTYPLGTEISSDIVKDRMLYYVQSGSVIVQSIHPCDDGHRIGLIREKGSFIGLEYLFMEETGGITTLEAVSSAEILSIPSLKLQKLLEGELADRKAELIQQIAKEMTEAYHLMRRRYESMMVHNAIDLVLHSVRHIAETVGMTHTPTGGRIIPMKAPGVSKVSGISEEMTRRHLKALVDRGHLARISEGFILLS